MPGMASSVLTTHERGDVPAWYPVNRGSTVLPPANDSAMFADMGSPRNTRFDELHTAPSPATLEA